METMLALVGEQTMPVVIPVFRFRPRRLVLLCTQQSIKSADYIRRALSLAELTSNTQVIIHPETVPPYDPEHASRICSDALAGCGGDSTCVNISAGTKIMSAAATLSAQRAGAELIYTITEGKGAILRWAGREVRREEVRVHIPIDVRFACHGLSATPGATWDERFLEASRVLAGLVARNPRQRLVGQLARVADPKHAGSVYINRSSPAERSAAHNLAEMGFWHAHCESGGTLKISLFEDDVIREFVSGKWLEAFVYQACARPQGDGPIFDCCWPNVIISDSEGCVSNELDLVLCWNEEMAICSCKAGGYPAKNDARDAIYELDSVAGPMRAGKYCRKVLIAAHYDLTPTALERAADSRISAITGRDLPRVASILSKVMQC